jgi:hypothetical protein
MCASNTFVSAGDVKRHCGVRALCVLTYGCLLLHIKTFKLAIGGDIALLCGLNFASQVARADGMCKGQGPVCSDIPFRKRPSASLKLGRATVE